ncbi:MULTISPECIES: endonuclease NucS domain-containing protein [Hydrocarboniphaga]|jgi:RecB family endonuclease NucS|uniref:endonuclease NucS domain-containing protein n=1 Tax=Hydrocarboniphaga TaxID=243627 RepID=UPI002ABCC4EB|nr:endonuclease NucS domain-containing protein [Hydrocarboniphaga sp.]MDZ4078508.1 endonuclease NucS [Hydrocarboniphaga sp.]
MGRRILVRWDLTVGPDNQDLVVQLPTGGTLSSGELRPTVGRVYSKTLDQFRREMNEPTNWISLIGAFSYEKALSDFIANYPGRLEDGLLPHPNSKIREHVFKDRSRLDVLLIDRQDRPVIVECKQHSPSPQDVQKLRHYIRRLKEETGQRARGILVHDGAAKLGRETVVEAMKKPVVEIVNYNLEVAFRSSLMSTESDPE